MVTTVGPVSTTILKVSGLETPSGSQFLQRHAVTPANQGCHVAHGAISNSLVGEGGSGWVVNTLSPSVQEIQTSPSPILWL